MKRSNNDDLTDIELVDMFLQSIHEGLNTLSIQFQQEFKQLNYRIDHLEDQLDKIIASQQYQH